MTIRQGEPKTPTAAAESASDEQSRPALPQPLLWRIGRMAATVLLAFSILAAVVVLLVAIA